MGALVLSWDLEVDRRGASVALEAPSGNQTEVDEGDPHHSLVGAWEEGVLSCLDAWGDPWDAHRALSVACPCVDEGACRGVEAPGAGWILGGPVEAPYLGDGHEGA